MALINCPECGKEVSDSVKKCPNCGFNIKKALNQTPEKRKKKRIKLLIILGSIFLVIVAVLAALFLFVFLPKFQKETALKNSYTQACKLMDDKQYTDAIKKFEKISDYKDSSDKIIECHYLYGKDWYDDHCYQESLEQFEAIEDYKDASDYISDCEYYITLNERKNKLANAYNSVKYSDNASLSSDGLSLTIDSDSEYDFESVNNIFRVIEKLGLPDSLEDSMSSTNSLMGRLEETYDEFTVSWSYHPRNGLDAIFEVNKP